MEYDSRPSFYSDVQGTSGKGGGGDARGDEGTYAVEVDGDGAARVQRGGLAVQREDFAHDADGLVAELLEVVGVDPGGRFRGHGEGWECRSGRRIT